MTVPPEVLAIGEAMVLVSPSLPEALETADVFRLDPAGAEANVASHLAAMHRRAAWAGALGDDALGHRLARQLCDRGVDTGWVVFDADAPTGVYVKDPGRAVLYYRSGSAASCLGPAFVDGLPIASTRVVHLTGITPALSGSCDALVEAVFEQALAAGTTVSFDVNHRPQLWPSAEAAAIRLRELAARADLVFVGLDEAAALWNCATEDDVRAVLPGPRVLVVKDGAVAATEFSTDAGVDDTAVRVPALPVELVEAVGAGDAFAAGYLAAFLDGAPARDRLRAGHERAVLALADTADFPRREPSR